MFWKLIMVAMMFWAVALYFSLTLGGMIHLVPAVAFVCVVVRRLGKEPDTEFGRWRSRAVRPDRP
jgi:F0F1-type ATP synthase assembly protein I